MGHTEGVNGIDSFNAVLDQYGELPPEMPYIRTPRGGIHVYGKQPADREPLGNRQGIWPGVDTRGFGGFVCAPGSVLADGTFYETIEGTPDLCEAFAAGAIPYWPAWFIEQIERPPEQPERGPSSPEPADADDNRLRAWGEGVLRNVTRRLAATSVGGRNAALNSAVMTLAGHAARCRLNESEVLDALWNACVANRYIGDDGPAAFNATFRGAWRDGLARPLPGPRERYPDDPRIIIDLKEKEPAGS